MCPSPTATELPGPRGPAGETASKSGGEAADYLSALPDDLLHRIMSSLKAWEVVRTCVLARRWRHLWASAHSLDLRTRYSTRESAPVDLRDFVHRLFRDASAPLDTLRLRSSEMLEDFSDDDSSDWINVAMMRKARVIDVVGHRRFPALLKGVSFVSCHLKVLKLSYARLDDRILRQLSCSCTCLEELDLKDCSLMGDEIVSASLRTLIMLECKIDRDLLVAAPNLVCLRLITPYGQVPFFKNLGSLVTATIKIDDYFFSDDISVDDAYDDTTDDDEHITNQEDCDETTDDDGPEHIIDQEDCDETADDRDNRNHGSELIIDEEDSDETTVAAAADDDSSNCGSESINDQEDCNEPGTSEDDDNTNCGSEHTIGQEDSDEITEDDDNNCNCGSEHTIGQEDRNETSYDNGDCNCGSEHIIDQEDTAETTDDEGTSEDGDFEETIDEEDGSDNSNSSEFGYGCGGQKDNYGRDSDIDSDENTYEYSEIAKEADYDYHADSENSNKDANYHSYEINASEYLGGQNILRSISNVTSLGLLTDAGEVVLSRELRRCPTFSKLKTLSLGEWCMAADFDAVIFLLQHSPSIERLFLQLKLNFDTRSRKAFKTGIKLQGRSFTCKDLQMVKIKCSKDDARVHKLANLFIANGLPLEKILVRRSGSAFNVFVPELSNLFNGHIACFTLSLLSVKREVNSINFNFSFRRFSLPTLMQSLISLPDLRAQELTDQAMHELMLFGPKWTNTKSIKYLERSLLATEIRL